MKSNEWHKHDDGVWHKVNFDYSECHKLTLDDFYADVQLGVEFTNESTS